MIRSSALLVLTSLAVPAVAQEVPYDVAIIGGLVVDGTGNPARRVDIAIRGDTIVAVGRIGSTPVKKTVDAKGLHVTPGFIDLHSHADRAMAGSNVPARRAPNLVTQGITTVVFGADGRNVRPTIATEMAAFKDPGVGINVVPVVGHGTVRRRAMGAGFRRPAKPDELERMKGFVQEGMEAGAWGLGAGLEYPPGRYSTVDEVVELAKVVARYDGFYYAHQRSQSTLPRWQLPSMVDGPTLDGIDGIKETIRIAAEAGIRAVGSHIKAKGRGSWGRAVRDTQLIDAARAQGHQVYLDQYPYETYNGGAGPIFPSWALAGGPAELGKRLDDPTTRARFTKDLAFVIDLHGGPGRLIITQCVDPDCVGKTVEAVAKEREQTMEETLIAFAMKGTPRMPAGHLVRPMGMCAADVEHYMRQEYTATCTDAGVVMRRGGPPGRHPRFWGSYPRKIAHYVKDRGVISLAFAVRSMTSLGAQIIGLSDRGVIRPGAKADLVVFDLDALRDHATVMQPGRPSEGIHHVLVNGVFAMEGKKTTDALAGRVLDRREGR